VLAGQQCLSPYIYLYESSIYLLVSVPPAAKYLLSFRVYIYWVFAQVE